MSALNKTVLPAPFGPRIAQRRAARHAEAQIREDAGAAESNQQMTDFENIFRVLHEVLPPLAGCLPDRARIVRDHKRRTIRPAPDRISCGVDRNEARVARRGGAVAGWKVPLARRDLALPSAGVSSSILIAKALEQRHVPAKILQVGDIPRTKSGKLIELAVRDRARPAGQKRRGARQPRSPGVFSRSRGTDRFSLARPKARELHSPESGILNSGGGCVMQSMVLAGVAIVVAGASLHAQAGGGSAMRHSRFLGRSAREFVWGASLPTCGRPDRGPRRAAADIPARPISGQTARGVAARRAERSSQSVSGRRRLGTVARRQEVGLDGERGHCTRRHDLGDRPMRRFRSGRHDLRRTKREHRSGLSIRCVRQAAEELGRGNVRQPAQVDRRQETDTCGWPTTAATRSSSSRQDGKVLMTLGKKGVAGAGLDEFDAPTEVGDRAKRRHLRRRRPHRRRHGRRQRAHREVQQGRQVHQDLGQERDGPRRVRRDPYPGLRFERAAVCRRSSEQPNPDLRPGRQVHRAVVPVRPAERHLHRPDRPTRSMSPTRSRGTLEPTPDNSASRRPVMPSTRARNAASESEALAMVR